MARQPGCGQCCQHGSLSERPDRRRNQGQGSSSAGQGSDVGSWGVPLSKAEAEAAYRGGKGSLAPRLTRKRACANGFQTDPHLCIESTESIGMNARRRHTKGVSYSAEGSAVAEEQERGLHVREGR